MEKVLVIVGPIAVGKTALSIVLTKKFNGEIISDDSMQAYRSLDIGTTKVTETEKGGTPHYLTDCREASETHSAADFQKEGRQKIREITEKGKPSVIVGGTGLYIQSLLYNFQLGSCGINDSPEIREAYNSFAEEKGNQALWLLLQQKDPLVANSIHFNSHKKMIRTLEVLDKTGYSILISKEKPTCLYDYYLLGLETDRTLLYERINQRVSQMMTEGPLEEAKQMFQQPHVQAAQGIDYREFFPHFSGEQSLEMAVEIVKQQSWRYAKHQLTWFRNRMAAHWWNLVQQPTDLPKLEKGAAEWLQQKESE